MSADFQELLSGSAEDRLIVFEQDGYPVHTKFLRSPVQTSRLVVTFHGAISRKATPSILDRTRNFKSLTQFAHQISILDPTVIRNERLAMGWYLGDHQYPAQEVLRAFIGRLVQHLQIERVVFAGSSGGGFAALYFGFHHPNSVVLAVNPQTRPPFYFAESGRRAFPAFCATCWPGMSESEVYERVCVDVTKLYAEKPFHNSVIYIMSPGDTRHYAHHTTAFLSQVYGALEIADINLSLISDYWGIPGHSGSVPASSYLPWLRAALTAPSISQQDILDSYHAIKLQTAHAASEKRTRSSKDDVASYSSRDLELARVLQRYQVGSTSGGHL